MNKFEANKTLSELVNKAKQALSEAEDFATEHKLCFSFSPAYGMGGYFDGEHVGQENEYGDESDGWSPSSQSC